MKKTTTIFLFIKKQIREIKIYGISEIYRKFLLFLNLLRLIIFDLFALMPCFLIRLVSPLILIRIQKIPSSNFGDFNLYPAIYYCKKKLKIEQPQKKYIDFVYIHYNDKIHNKQLAKMWKRKLNFLSGYILDPISRVNKLLPGWKKHTIETLYNKQREIDNLFEKCKSIEFSKEEQIFGRNILKKFGLKDEDKFVCFAIRDGAYQLKKISARYRDWFYQDFRNYDIDRFLLAAEELTKRGYFVFRMGVVAKKPFRSKNPKIIDYANSSLRSDFMDIYLGANCSFCVATNYGFDALPNIFGRPIVMLGQPLGDLRTNNENFLLMTKHHIYKKEKRRLTLSEIFSFGLAFAYDSKIFQDKGGDLVDNTPQEIKDLAVEMTEYVESNKKLNNSDEELQKTFKELYSYNLKRFNLNKRESYALHGAIKSRFSTKFLRENRDWLN